MDPEKDPCPKATPLNQGLEAIPSTRHQTGSMPIQAPGNTPVNCRPHCIYILQYPHNRLWQNMTVISEATPRKVLCLLKPVMRAYMLSHFGHIWLFATLWTIARQAPLSLGFSRQEYWSGLPPCPPPGGLPDPGIKPVSLMFPAQAGRLFTTHTTWEAPLKHLPWPGIEPKLGQWKHPSH